MTTEQQRILEAALLPGTGCAQLSEFLVQDKWYRPKNRYQFVEDLLDQAQIEIDRYKLALEKIQTRCTSVASCVKVAQKALDEP